MFKAQEALMKYLSIKEVSEKGGISTRCIQILCKKGPYPRHYYDWRSDAPPLP